MWVALVLTKVWSRPHHLRHHWPQISTFVSLNHIHHHTYFKSSYVHIQVFHILHHHTMKLLLAFKSFLPRRPIVEIGSENWFDAGCQFDSKCYVAAANMFCGSECYLAANNSISTASHKFAAKQYNFGSESQFRCRTCNSAVNANSQQPIQFRQRITNSLQTTQLRQRITNSL